MADFMIHFLICNVFISGIILILLIAKRLFKSTLSSRMQYDLWFLLLGLLTLPFIPLRLTEIPQIFSYLECLMTSTSSGTKETMKETAGNILTGNTNWMNDFYLSVNNQTPAITGYLLFGIWIVGIFVMLFLLIRSSLRLHGLMRSALPLQNKDVHRLYQCCLNEMKIHRKIPIFSTAFLKSPIIVGLLRPRIYLPIHLISDYEKADMRYMLLHELQHYKHHDAIANYLMNLARIIYWFNPFVWYALKEMRIDREVACDTSVLKLLTVDDYQNYGNTLINFAEKMSMTSFPFATGIGGNIKQLKRRIINITSYKKPTLMKNLKGMAAFMLTAILLLGFAPFISTYAADGSYYQWDSSLKTVSYIDLSTYFGEYKGCFVLYDLENDAWHIHNKEQATLRVSPNSTYKIYTALLGLEEGVITPEDSFITWNGERYPFEAWNENQTLQSAMSASVNWYFQAVDEQVGTSKVYHYIQEIGYGNENMSGDFSTYWMESSLKISPIEQVELLTRLQNNSFGFSSENIHTVNDTICLSSSDAGTIYGKTGTGRVNGQDVNGWFIGFVENADNTYFFAVNIGADSGATGNNAAKITMSILSDMNIWN